MGNDKWRVLREQDESTYIKAFKDGFLKHLSDTDVSVDEGVPSNLPRKVLNRAIHQKSLGLLSRIFDEFRIPVPPYDEIPKNAADLFDHIQDNLNKLMPLLLNENKDGLSEAAIEAIGRDIYEELLAIPSNAGNAQQEIAKQFISAIIISYAQRIIDQTTSDDVKLEIFHTISPILTGLAGKVTLNGIPQQVREEAQESIKKEAAAVEQLKGAITELNKFRQLIEELKQLGITPDSDALNKALEDAQLYVDDRFMQANMKLELIKDSLRAAEKHYNAFINNKIKQGEIDEKIKQGEEQLNTLNHLVAQGREAGLKFNPDILEKIQKARDIFQNTNLKPVDKLINASETYKGIIESLHNDVKNLKPETPKEVNIFLKLLRFITRNERLFQNADEARFEVIAGIRDVTKDVEGNEDKQPEPSPRGP